MNQFKLDNDELDDVVPTQSPKAGAPAQASTQQASKQAVSQKQGTPMSAPADDEVGFDDEDVEKYGQQEDFLPVIKINKGEVARFAFIPGYKLKHALVHYVEGHGSFRCLSTKEHKAVCCTRGGKPKSRFVGLVYRYTNVDPKTGKFASNDTMPQVAVQAVRLSRSNYRDINDAVEEGQSVYGVDFKMKHDESRAFGYKFGKISSQPRWKMIEASSDANILRDLTLGYEDGTKLSSRLGKTLSTPELVAILAGASEADTHEASLADIEDID